MTTTVRVQLLMGLATLALVTLAGSPAARAAGVVTTCDEAHLDTALVGGGLVTFDCGDDATITVTSMKTVSADTTIDGGGMITISGGNSVAVFFVKSGVEFTVQNLTIANGNDAAGNFSGAIDTGDTGGGTLTITNSTFSGNSGSAIGGKHETVTIINSTFSGNSAGGSGGSGGAISNDSGTLTVINSTFSGNSASAGSGGGAISYVGTGTARVIDSTFSGNSASAGSGGGAISYVGTGMARVTNSTFSGNSAGSGGGIFNQSTLTVANSTFSGNSASGNGAGGGINNNSGTLTVTNSTFSSNSTGTIGGTGGGGINNSSGTVTVTNSIVANSTSGGNCGGTITDGGHNIDDGTTCGFSTANASLDSTDPQLDPVGLQNNGGATQTIAMLPSSPAIDAGDDSVCAAPPVNHFDQRGFVRPGAGHSHCSVGAFEFYSVGNPTPTPTPIPVPCVGDCDGMGSVTVNEIIALVNIALGNTEASACMHGVPSGAEVDIALIIQAVNNALNECPA